MTSPIVIATAVESGFGFLLTSTILYLVLSRGRKAYHYLFAAFLLICTIWDLGIFLTMIRNEHVAELDIIGRIAILPCTLIPALIFHFANLYAGRPIKWAVALVWISTIISWGAILAGLFYRIEGVYTYNWGNIFRVTPSVLDPMIFIFWFGINLWACWLLFKGARRATSRLERRHFLYIISGFLAITFAIVKALVTMGIDVSFLLPLGMLLNDTFATVIGLAIVKEKLLDITVIIKKGTLYSLLAGLLIFVYSFSEHILVTYIGETIGEHSSLVQFVSIAVGIAVLLPVKNRLERALERYFAHRKLEF
jgi:CDP-diglyceride synthetase